ncbi:MAG: ABC transporter permease [Cyclobacteriaceae bacterium]
MLKNYFNIAFRNLTKHSFYSVINILGLSVGLTCFLFIALFVKDELSYDTHFKDSEKIYRTDFTGMINGNEIVAALMCSPAAKSVKETFPNVEDAFRFRGTGNWFVKKADSQEVFKFEQTEVVYADDNFFTFWSKDLIYGNPETCLLNPKTLVLDKTTAKKIFGDINPVGETLILDNEQTYKVGGVYEDLPRNSHFHYNIMLTLKDHWEYDQPIWMSFNFNTYLKFREGADVQTFSTDLPKYMESKFGPDLQKFMGTTYEEFLEAGNSAEFRLIPLADIHLKSDKLGDIEPNGDIKYVYIFSAIGAFILLLACINFMNLATARSAGRAKEVGLRKAMGAVKSQLIGQFLSEAIIISFLSTIIAFFLAGVLLPYFETISGKSLADSDLLSSGFMFIMFGVALVSGLLAGSYPAFYLSAFKPVETLKGRLNLGLKSGGLRSALVVFQFVVSIAMIIGTAVVYDQLSFIQNKKLGFTKDQVIAVDDIWVLDKKKEAFMQEAMRSSQIASGSLTSFVPIGSVGNNSAYWPGETVNKENTYVFNHRSVDYDYVETLEMNVVEGRNFSRDFPTDTLAILVNEALVKAVGIDEPIGFKISTFADFGGSQEVVSYRIVGVLEDFHYESMKTEIDPVLFKLSPSGGGSALFRVTTNDLDGVVASLKSAWNSVAAGQPFEYYFLDQKFDNQYRSEQRIGQVFVVFAILAIFIACLGLFGLASFTAEQRIKEIGIRKVLGASVTQIVNMLSWNFMKLVGIAFIFAAPLAYFGMRSWLDDFAYRTDLKIWIFAVAGLVACVIAWLTMGFQSWRAARSNPANSLRNE